jgi:hypothetical protein
MVSQQAIRVRISHRLGVFGVESEEIPIVALFEKDVLPVVATVVDVIVLTVLEWGRAGHGSLL